MNNPMKKQAMHNDRIWTSTVNITAAVIEVERSEQSELSGANLIQTELSFATLGSLRSPRYNKKTYWSNQSKLNWIELAALY